MCDVHGVGDRCELAALPNGALGCVENPFGAGGYFFFFLCFFACLGLLLCFLVSFSLGLVACFVFFGERPGFCVSVLLFCLCVSGGPGRGKRALRDGFVLVHASVTETTYGLTF